MVLEDIVYRYFFFLAEHKNGSTLRLIIDNFELNGDSIVVNHRGAKSILDKQVYKLLVVTTYPFSLLPDDILYYYRDKGDQIIENCNRGSSDSEQRANSESD